MTESQQTKAILAFPPLARFWGDEVTPELRGLVTLQFQQIRRAAAKGIRTGSLRRADYLAISGGGGNGAYGAGFLKGWSERGDRPQFEVVTGVSTGALAAPFVFLGQKYDRELEDIYTKYGDRQIMRSRGVFGIFGDAFYDSSPLRGLVTDYLTEDVLDAISREYQLGRRLLVQTTNIDAERPVVWDVSAICASHRKDRRELVVKILLASAAIPAIFPPVKIPVQASDGKVYQELHVDGGVAAQVFFAPPEIGLDNFELSAFSHTRQRTLYVIRNGQLNPEYQTSPDTVLPLAQRAIGTMIKYQGVADLNRLEALTSRGNAKLFYTAIPDDFIGQKRSQFDTDYMTSLFKLGVQAGVAGNWRTRTPETPILSSSNKIGSK
ncbi:patatin-like phospholipase family protein [Rhizobium sp. S152]|uniref:patatin-like phospholipase family protein n=1 Tax=Rhizobium sp. S152 TaxID=3055038 RepID=UPI0025A97248|nr:patatin-like phospholipase family protein [Rhizobium sp. S152]MDM9627583.1 patatin-like phospholipase family protein [Rhizobium sp. S152]